MLRRLKQAAGFFFWGGATWLALLPLLWRLSAERQWLLVLCQYSPPLLYFLAWLKLVGLAALARPRRAVLGLLPPLAWLLTVIAPFQLHKAQAGDLSALSWNIQAGLSGPDKIGELLAQTRTDLIALQEARVPSAQPGGLDPVPTVLQHTRLNVARGGERGELVIMSRFTMISQRLYNLGGLSQALEARLEVNGKIIRALNVHLMTGDPQGLLKGQPLMSRRRVIVSAATRRLQANSLVQAVESGQEPVILMGDFNSPPSSVAYHTLCTQLQDSFSAAGWGWGLTYPASHPLWRIDYIWCKGMTPVGSQVLDLPASDHRAVQAQIKL
ncbi:endonuclease/exonuclease/phosphatase family protein [bacterium]|nr:endonuclease/exonuclease/phosphatase family protein [bacterium]